MPFDDSGHVEWHAGNFFVQSPPERSARTFGIVVRVAQAHVSNATHRANCSIQIWEDVPPALIHRDQIRELARALERAADAIEAAGGQDPVLPPGLRVVRAPKDAQ